MPNLLRNPSFEQGWTDYNESIQIPNDWRVWWADASTLNPYDPVDHSKFVAPEIVHKLRSQIPENEHPLFFVDGDTTLKIFKQYGSFYVSMSQNLDLAPGRYKLTVRAFPDAIDRYEGGEKVPAPDPDSALIAFGVNGVDTPWGTMWPFLQLNAYDHLFDADGPTDLRVGFMFPFPLANSGLFTDGWELTRVEEPQPHRGTPRVQYARAYNVIPQDATEEQAVAVFREGWRRSRETSGGSYDDAGIGDLDARKANLYGIAAEKQPDYTDFFRQYYPGVDVAFKPLPGETPPPPPPPTGEFLSLHRQSGMDGLLQFVDAVKPRWLKLVFEMEAAKEIKAVSPDTKIVYRHVNNDQQPFYGDPDVAGAVDRWLAQFWEGIKINAQWIDAVEGLNEEIPTAIPDKLKQVARFEAALSDEVARRDIGVGAVIVNAAVGNPGHNEVRLLLPAAEAAVRNNHLLGYHSYFPCHPNYAEQWMADEGIHHHMRALLSWDPWFAAVDLKPRYLFTESGAIGAYVREDGRPGGYVSAASGWRAPECLGGNWERYRNLLNVLRWMIADWNVDNSYRAEGAMIFTVYNSGWRNFRLGTAELLDLAAALAGG